MKKLILANLIFTLVSLAVSSANGAVYKSTVISNNILYTDNGSNNKSQLQVLLHSFDGYGFGKYGGGYFKKGEVESIVKANLGASQDKTLDVSYLSKLDEQNFKMSNSKAQYVLSSSKEDFENGLGSRVNQMFYDKNKKLLETKSMTFVGESLRAITTCSGGYVYKKYLEVNKKVLFDRDNANMICATATPKVCQSLLNEYNKQAINNSDLRSAKEMKAKVDSCKNIMDGYSKVLLAFTKLNAEVSNSYNDIVSAEEKNLKAQMDGVKEYNSSYDYINSISSKKGFQELSDRMTSSMDGIAQINKLISLCQDNINNFDSRAFDSNFPVPSSDPRSAK